MEYVQQWMRKNRGNIGIENVEDLYLLLYSLNNRTAWRSYFIRPKTFFVQELGHDFISVSGICNKGDLERPEFQQILYGSNWGYMQYRKICCGIRLSAKKIEPAITYEKILPYWISHYRKIFRDRRFWLSTPSDIQKRINPRIRIPISKKTRNEIYERDQGKCRYCGTSEGKFHIDHVVPVSQGGNNGLCNLVLACSKCNLMKSGKTPRQAGMELI